MFGHLVSQQGGQAGLGCQLQREAGQIGQIGQVGVAGGDRHIDDPRQCRGEQLAESRPDGGLIRGGAGQFGEELGEESGFPVLADGELGGGGGEGGQLRGVG